MYLLLNENVTLVEIGFNGYVEKSLNIMRNGSMEGNVVK